MNLEEEINNIIYDCDPWDDSMDYEDRNKAAQRIIGVFIRIIDDEIKQLRWKFFDENNPQKKVFNRSAENNLCVLGYIENLERLKKEISKNNE